MIAAQKAGQVDMSKITPKQWINILRGDVTSDDYKLSATKQLTRGQFISRYDGPAFTGTVDIRAVKFPALPFAGTVSRRAKKAFSLEKIPPEIKNAAVEASQRYKVPVSLIFAILQYESGFKSGVVSTADARGVGQLMPYTITSSECRPIAKELGIDVGTKKAGEAAARNNKFNVLCSAAHLRTWYNSRQKAQSADPGPITSSRSIDAWYRAICAYFSGRNGDRALKRYFKGPWSSSPQGYSAGKLKSMGHMGKIIVYGNSVLHLWKEYDKKIGLSTTIL